MNILDLNARDIRNLIVNKEITATEIVLAYIAQIEEQEKDINAFITWDKEGALSAAKKIDDKLNKGETLGKLAGVVIALKDNIVTKDMKTTCGSKTLEDFQSPYDATVVEIIKNEDGIIIGKTNMDEFSMGSSTRTSYFGATKNPLNTELVPGGSSGGSAAVIQAKMACVSLGSDTGGSVRQPASFCGVVGVKPSYGRISRYGLTSLANTLDQIGIFTKDTLDASFILSILSGHDEKDPTSVDVHMASNYEYGPTHMGKAKEMRLAIPKELLEMDMDEEVRQGFLKTIESIKLDGYSVEEISIPSLKYALETYLLILSAEASSNLARFDGLRYGYRTKEYETLDELYIKSRTEAFGEEVKRRILLGTYILGEGHSEDYYLKALKLRTLIIEEFKSAFENIDMLVLPTSPILPFALGDNIDTVDMYRADRFTVFANLVGACAISIPSFNDDNLSIGIQLVADKFKEEDLVNMAVAVERMVK